MNLAHRSFWVKIWNSVKEWNFFQTWKKLTFSGSYYIFLFLFLFQWKDNRPFFISKVTKVFIQFDVNCVLWSNVLSTHPVLTKICGNWILGILSIIHRGERMWRDAFSPDWGRHPPPPPPPPTLPKVISNIWQDFNWIILIASFCICVAGERERRHKGHYTQFQPKVYFSVLH